MDMQLPCRSFSILTISTLPAVVLFIATFIFAIAYKGYKHVKPSKDNIVNKFIGIIFYSIYVR